MRHSFPESLQFASGFEPVMATLAKGVILYFIILLIYNVIARYLK